VSELAPQNRFRWGLLLTAITLAVLLVLQRAGCAAAVSSRKDASSAESVSSSASCARLDPSSAESPSAKPVAAVEAGSALDATGGLSLTWGSGPGELGHLLPSEGNPEGPMSLALVGKDTWVLDQVNERAVLLGADGRALRSVPVSRTAQDLVVAADGTTAVLDRHGAGNVHIVSADGHSVELPVVGKGLEQAGAATGLFLDGKNVYVEREHGGLLRIGDVSGAPGDREQLSGRPSKDGQTLASAWKAAQGNTAFLYSAFDRSTRSLRFTRRFVTPFYLSEISLLDTDLAGTLYVGVRGLTPQGAMLDDIRVFCFESKKGDLTGTASYPASQVPEESFKDAAVSDAGMIRYQVRSETGVRIAETRCHAP
jgi:hypothetical protein